MVCTLEMLWWEGKFASVVFLPKAYNSSHTTRKTSDKPQLRDIQNSQGHKSKKSFWEHLTPLYRTKEIWINYGPQVTIMYQYGSTTTTQSILNLTMYLDQWDSYFHMFSCYYSASLFQLESVSLTLFEGQSSGDELFQFLLIWKFFVSPLTLKDIFAQ